MLKLRQIFVAFLLLGVLSPFLYAETQLVVLHSNDHHGHISKNGELGGLARFATLVKQIRSECQAMENTHVLLLDAGDINTGTPESDLFSAEPDIAVYNHLGYDFVTIGNHEFDPPCSKLPAQIESARFPWGSANVLGPDGQPLGTPYRVMDFPDCRVGLFGLTVCNTTILFKSEARFTIVDELETARRMVRFLREEKHVDVVIAVTHLGLLADVGAKYLSSDIAREVQGINLIVDGHSHTLMQEPCVVNGVPIVSANEWSKYLGEARLTVEKGKVLSFSWKCIPVTERIPEDPECMAILEPYIKEAREKLGQVVAHTACELPGDDKICRREETALGDLAGDAMMWAAKQNGIACDFAFINGGNVRATLPRGDVTLADVWTAFPYRNVLFVLDLDGKEVLKLFQFIAQIKPKQAANPQFSCEVYFRVNEQTGEILELKISGEPIQPEKHYRVVVTDFIAGGGDGYKVFDGQPVIWPSAGQSSDVLLAIVAAYMQTLPQPVNYPVGKRFIRE